jgi:dihydrofolate reductase
MRSLVINTFLTLDGVMQAPGGPQEDTAGGFTLGGWSVNYWDESMEQVMAETMAHPFDLLLGRKTYQLFAAHWPRVTDDSTADVLNGARKYVATRTLTDATWQNTVILDRDVVARVAELKAQDGPEIQVHGSSDLAQTLLAAQLIDEFRLWHFPVLVGKGKRLFRDGVPPTGLTLGEITTSSTGVIMTVWTRSGPIEPGSFALSDEPGLG